MEFLNELNEVQRQAVTSLEGPHMIIAGAGSGKTRVLTFRLAFIISQGVADAFECLALTFTNKAAKEMRERIQSLIGSEGKNLWMGTFHSIFSRILRQEAEKLGYTRNFTIYDAEDALKIVKSIVKELNLDDKKFKPKVIHNFISGAKNNLIDPAEYAASYVTDSFTNVVSRIYGLYNTRLFNSNAMDFDDLLVKPVELFEAHPEVLYHWQNRFKYIMVDEFQDTNHAQYVITKMLAAKHENICVVGDDAQSIYSFRGATIQNILNFRKNYPETKIFKLEQNYRSTQTIVGAANQIISRNKNQIQKTVFTENSKGDHIQIIEAASETEEARSVVDQIREQKMRYNYRNKDFAILYRTNAQSRSMESELRRANLDYKVFGGLSFYKRKEIKDVLAYLRLAINPQDEASLTRVINYPARGIGDTTLDKLMIAANDNGLNRWETLQRVREWGLGGRAAAAIEQFVLQIRAYGAVAQKEDAYEAAAYIAKHSGILKELHQDKSIESLSRWENVQELLNAAKQFSEDQDNDSHNLESFLAEISLFTDQDEKHENTDFVTLMTIHSAKGLEFPSVFLVGMEEELFPSFMAMQSRADLEEERRLFYVAVTRAEHRLTLTHAKSRFRYGKPSFNEVSRFVEEIGQEYLMSARQTSRPMVKQETERVSPAEGRFQPVRRSLDSRGGAAEEIIGDDLTLLSTGMEVVHSKFGSGKVVNIEGKDADRKATVFFKDKGQKVLLLKYAKLKIVH
ncbi:MAG: UvrD-helicase domain-containing protein [Bacteroidia bacterium]|nr:UvrD-helicase domain-containing protein [Bacteroidia bacterium]